jgi:activating signal cointegrator complex subunit 3
VESSQTVIRVVGLSATLPNYIDVATFLKVNPYVGLFFFDGRFRPVPLAQTFIGIKQVNQMRQRQDMDEVCYEKVVEFMRAGHQVMVFVHARNATVNTAMVLKEMAQQVGTILSSVHTHERILGSCVTKNLFAAYYSQRCGTVPYNFSLSLEW